MGIMGKLDIAKGIMQKGTIAVANLARCTRSSFLWFKRGRALPQ